MGNVFDENEVTSGWLDPENPIHRCQDEMPTDLGRKDWGRRWKCSCGQTYKVQDSQRDGFYFEAESTKG